MSGTGIDTTVPHSARIWNYWLGGKDNYAVDREAGDAWSVAQPEITHIARATRDFLRRAVTYQVREAGIRQFLDVGTGLPTADNTHEVAQRLAPESRIVYVDNDPLVLAHARALLTSTPQGATRYLHADMHQPESLIEGAVEILDLTRPVGVQFMGVLGHVADIEVARALVRGLMDRMPPGSHLTISDGAEQDDLSRKTQDEYADTGAVAYRSRPAAEIASLFDGLEWVEPGFVRVTQWRPGPSEIGTPQPLDTYGGVARKI